MFRKSLKLNSIRIVLTALMISVSILLCLPASHAIAAATETLRPTAHTISGNGTIINPQNAYDGSNYSYNTIYVGNNNADPTIEYHTWQTSSNEHSERRLYVRRYGRNNSDDNWSISYSINGGTNYTVIESGLTNPRRGNTAVVYIPTDLDLSLLVVKISTFMVGSDDNGYARIYEVWLDCDYEALPLVGTQIGAEYPIEVSPTTLTPQEQWTTITVPVAHGETLAHIDYVEVKLFYDSAGNDPDESGFSADAQNCAILSWTRSGWWGIWAIEPADTTWALDTSWWGCSKPSDWSTQGNWVFVLQIGKVATYSGGTGDWDIYAEALDDYSETGYDYLRDIEMNWYGEVSATTVTVNWSGIPPFSDFGDATKQTDVTVTYISNGPYYQKIAASTSWVGGVGNALLDTAGTPGSMEFSLKADDVDNLGSAVLVTGYPTYIAIYAGTQTTESGDEVSTNTIWLALGAIRESTYTGTIYYMISNS